MKRSTMPNDASLYDRALEVTQSNASLYDRWENQIAYRMAQKWKEAFSLAAKVSGSLNPTVTEVADMGESEVTNANEFIDDLKEIFKTLAKGCSLDSNGNWS